MAPPPSGALRANWWPSAPCVLEFIVLCIDQGGSWTNDESQIQHVCSLQSRYKFQRWQRGRVVICIFTSKVYTFAWTTNMVPFGKHHFTSSVSQVNLQQICSGWPAEPTEPLVSDVTRQKLEEFIRRSTSPPKCEQRYNFCSWFLSGYKRSSHVRPLKNTLKKWPDHRCIWKGAILFDQNQQ